MVDYRDGQPSNHETIDTKILSLILATKIDFKGLERFTCFSLMIITFYGGAQTVTGSKHLITLASGTRLLLDGGLFQGKDAKKNDDLGFDPTSVDYVILSHTHVDHSGLLPYLVKQGYSGPIYCTLPTRELCELILADSAHIQQSSSDAPLYGEADVAPCLEQFVTVPYGESYRISEEIELLFTDAGHVLGSAVVNLTLQEGGKTRTLCFSGDVGRFSNRILKAPQEFPQAEVILCESTYGDRFHHSLENIEERLREIIYDTCVEKQGKVLIPAFSLGRTQELIYTLDRLVDQGALANVNVFVDSPLSVYATDVIRRHRECFNESLTEYVAEHPEPFNFPNLHYVTEVEDSKLLHAVDEPCVIISSSGMMQAGRILHHLRHNVADERNTVLITGYCAPGTLGHALMQGAERVTILDEELPVGATVTILKEYSAHADYGDFLRFLFCQDQEKIQRIFLVHGEEPGMKKFKASLEKDGYRNVEIAAPMISYEV